MDFQNLNRLNVSVNALSGNLLPISDKYTSTPIFLKVYSAILWLVQSTYLAVCILGAFYVSKQKVLEDSTVNVIVSAEVFLQLVYLHNRKSLLRRLIKKLNRVLVADNEMLRSAIVLTLKPLKKPLKFYIFASVGTVAIWTSLPFIEVLKKKEFYYMDYRVPAVLSGEPFSRNIFITGVVFELFGSSYMIFKKVSLDIYMIHFILLITAQYRYLRGKFETIFTGSQRSLNVNREIVKKEVRLLTYHYGIVIEIAAIMKKLFSPNIGILYINNVFRFCFLSFMIVTSSTGQFGNVLVILYTIGALMQFYVLCFCIQQMFESSTAVFNDAFHKEWYIYDVPLQRAVAIMSLTNKLECKLSRFRNINLTLSSFMTILNQAYSVCLLFLKSRHV